MSTRQRSFGSRMLRRFRVGERELSQLRAQVRLLEQENAALGERIATEEQVSTARPEDEGSPQFDFLFVLTYGRSGSTLLQGVLNSIPGFLIRGENGGAFYHLQNFQQALSLARGEHGPAPLPSHPWFGAGGYDDRRTFAAIRHLALNAVLRPSPDSRTVGYKEIRWLEQRVETEHGERWMTHDLPGHVRFLENVFPKARFVVNTREHEDVARSVLWQGRPDALAHLAAQEEALLAEAERLGDAAFHVHYDDYSNDPDSLAALYAWLGEPFDLTMVQRVLARRHSY